KYHAKLPKLAAMPGNEPFCAAVFASTELKTTINPIASNSGVVFCGRKCCVFSTFPFGRPAPKLGRRALHFATPGRKAARFAYILRFLKNWFNPYNLPSR
ncbi:MAG: hypothetical protein WBD31_11720, partial [Rubripirellula sp.]